jgi:hypothetical protein
MSMGSETTGALSGYSIWHWLILLVVAALPFFLTYWAVRLGVRHGMKDASKDTP